MRYELMLPHQLRKAVEEGWPAVLPVGVLEYHGEHLALGMDALAVVKALEILEGEADLVILPPFYYGASSYAVASPEGNGSLHVDADTLLPFARGLFRALLRVGFGNIHFFIHHQTENFAFGMPTDLAFRLAARQAVFEFVEKERGEGWWGKSKMAGDLAGQDGAGDDPFGWIRGHPLLDQEAMGRFPFDHAGQGETSLMMAVCPQAVDMRYFSAKTWYTQSAEKASPELGAEGREFILAHMRRVLGLPTASR
jgi:creatinine amidohydrolase/Fe(II)-dependent formamide hydrolase-like protein